MIAAERTVLILLAAGRSLRFGEANKLSAELLGQPVGLHVTAALAQIPFLDRVAVVQDDALDFASHGYRVVHNDAPGEGMARSLRLGVECAIEAGADAVLVALADMPCVTAAHVALLLAAANSTDAVVASSNGGAPRPPALFGRDHFETLTRLSGDAGARDLLRGGYHVTAAPAELIDIDTREDLEHVRAALTRGGARRSG